MAESRIEPVWKIGELASEAGLTVRALHHYDRIGLVCPARRTTTGHRLYTETDVRRLYQVLALRQLGLSLDQIMNVLAGTVAMAQVLGAHRDRLAAQLAVLQDLHALVTRLAATAENEPDICADRFLALIRRTAMIDDTVRTYFTQDNATAFTVLYFAQLRARQGALELWYAADAQLTVGNTPHVGRLAIFEQLVRFPQADYNVRAIDVQAGNGIPALVRVTGDLMLEGMSDARQFETSFTLNDAHMIENQTFQGI
ncbi:MerR family transcriptional regulator [Nocardia yamanashiensis]|uniref:MerR family transcriptional regulator n=1 Tax=Nocardia yamanashiensis TaxID=209247 RepID=UPI001E35624E|nr:MerR family transcriptional regulator [Nocardia yamanashiensis]UGT44133.1 MerR family transcriptional regulator [Nocardia yamanashiensis]